MTLADSLHPRWAELGVEVIIVDNGSTDETRSQCLNFAERWQSPWIILRTVFLTVNLGYPSGINKGLAESQGRVVAVLNNDLVFPPNWLDSLVHVVESDKRIGLAAPYLSFGASQQNVNRTFTTYEEMVRFAADFTRENQGQVEYVDKVIGACVVMRRDFLLTVGGNDFWYGIGNYDDDDWCLRARIAGYKIAIVGGSFVQHVGHATFRLNANEQRASLTVNARKFASKWDIAHTENPRGLYSRAGAIRHIGYDRGKHFIPVDVNDFSQPTTAYYPKTTDVKRVLLSADWTSPTSDWTSTITQLLLGSSDTEICLWIPSGYFDRDAVLTQVQELILSSQVDTRSKGIEFVIFSEEIAPVDTLRVMKSADAVVMVPGDFVSRYIVCLANEIDIEVVDPCAMDTVSAT